MVAKAWAYLKSLKPKPKVRWYVHFASDLIECFRIFNANLENLVSVLAAANEVPVPASPTLVETCEPGLYRANPEAQKQYEDDRRLIDSLSRNQEMYDWRGED